MGSHRVIAQNGPQLWGQYAHFRTNQNVERLHGASFKRFCAMYSPGHLRWYPIHVGCIVRVGLRTLTPAMPKKQKTTRKKGSRRGAGAYYPGGMTLRGKGGFFQDVGNFFKKAAGPLLGAAGGVANTIWPGSGMVADGIRKLIGSGAYSPVRSNAILAQPVPRVGSSQDVGVTYSHCEYLGDVTGSSEWELTQFHVNPGLPEVFPWLSGVASNFQKYRIDGLVFYIRSTSSVAIASTDNLALGTVMGGFQHNVYDKAPGSKLEFLALSGARSGKPSEDHIFPMECDRSKNVFGNLLVRTVGVVDDLAKYDHAVFNLATVGFPGEYYLGELWVSYKLTLMAPKVESAVPVLSTLPVATTSAGVTTYTPRYMPSTMFTVGSNSWFIHQPLFDDAAAMTNTTGWKNGSAADGLPCMYIPAGTNGYFLFKAIVCEAGSTNSTDLVVLDSSGSCEQDNTTVSPWDKIQDNVGPPSGYNYATSWIRVYHVTALPDRELHLRWRTLKAGTQQTAVAVSLDVVRLPDKIFAKSASATTVTLAQKVVRLQQRRAMLARQAAILARQAAEAAEEKETLLEQPVLYRTEAGYQTQVGTPYTSGPLPVRPACPPPETGIPSASLAKFR